ncbi:unnamed protein product [Caenorhabditis auriculariae]|uniref:BPTI/Kunitz inhibitor domain-containing protein n=1 Tax=Caenorhabditis auriculariae TaxID=2777116 RepID=A0A8S1HMI1_9PELO|nr:unnamed protein product [Caenorhabditis auriculariae]
MFVVSSFVFTPNQYLSQQDCFISHNIMAFFKFISFLALLSGSVALDCLSARDSGDFCNAGPQRQMYYFVPAQGICQPFMYNGCGGNENRFNSSAECREACANASTQVSADGQTSGRSEQMKQACQATYDTEHLNATLCSRHMECPAGHDCHRGFCCPTPDYACNLRYDSGKFAVGGEKSDKYFYTPQYQTCMRFSFYGTLGNANNFPNYNACMKMCSSQIKNPRI